jgi:ribosomal protein S27AE
LGSQDHSNQLLKYYCSKCDTLLKETNIDTGLSNSKEECPHCGDSKVIEIFVPYWDWTVDHGIPESLKDFTPTVEKIMVSNMMKLFFFPTFTLT